MYILFAYMDTSNGIGIGSFSFSSVPRIECIGKSGIRPSLINVYLVATEP